MNVLGIHCLMMWTAVDIVGSRAVGHLLRKAAGREGSWLKRKAAGAAAGGKAGAKAANGVRTQTIPSWIQTAHMDCWPPGFQSCFGLDFCSTLYRLSHLSSHWPDLPYMLSTLFWNGSIYSVPLYMYVTFILFCRDSQLRDCESQKRLCIHIFE